MTTGYFYADWRQGGSVPGKTVPGAGNLLTVLDWCMLQGPSPWSKTIDGTNLVTYTAPGGSQIALQFDDTQAASVSYHCRVRATVGGQVFPTPAQETSRGYVYCRRTYNTGTGTGWYAIRTDRMFMFLTNNVTGVGGACSFHAFGDMPVLDPLDPGLCVSLGWQSTAYPTANQNTESILPLTALYSSATECGYTYSNKTGSTFSIPVSLRYSFYSQVQTTPLSNWAGQIPLTPLMIWTGTTQTSFVPILRGWIPYMYIFPSSDVVAVSGSTTSGDTLSAGSATFEIHNSGASTRWAFMTNDQEDLP